MKLTLNANKIPFAYLEQFESSFPSNYYNLTYTNAIVVMYIELKGEFGIVVQEVDKWTSVYQPNV